MAVLDIEFEYYSVVYFECITELRYTFDAKLPLGAARAHTHFLDISDIHALIYIVHMSPTPSGSSAL